MNKWCPFCKNPLLPWHHWRASDGRFYCNEFCADAAEDATPLKCEFPTTPTNAQKLGT